MFQKWTPRGAAPVALAVGLYAIPAIAQQAAAPIVLEEIIVTAERRSTNLQDTPIAITALTAEDLREKGVVDLKGVADATPNFQMTTSGNGSGGSNFAQLFIRGVGQPDFIITKDPAVGIYIDGVYLARAPGAVLELLDIERVEVLRGPQGTLFGKNTSGGALNITTKAPSDDFGGVAELRVGNYGRMDVGGSVNVPLVEDKLALRVSALSRDQDGYYKRLLPSADGTKRNGNDVNVRSGRATLAWTPTDSLQVTLSGDVTRERQAATDYQAVG
ncbi:TonB-dependent receptor, partial [Niveispirillum sp.]|uniref:TonB-dependent receptor n=1 Tax=Niveispirillum sp. TaxID=1917217 RepID=UPI001B555970